MTYFSYFSVVNGLNSLSCCSSRKLAIAAPQAFTTDHLLPSGTARGFLQHALLRSISHKNQNHVEASGFLCQAFHRPSRAGQLVQGVQQGGVRG